jgi:hypothetical protein
MTGGREMSKDQWFANFERNLSENGWLDNMDRDDLYEQAGEDALEEQLDAADFARKLERENP